MAAAPAQAIKQRHMPWHRRKLWYQHGPIAAAQDVASAQAVASSLAMASVVSSARRPWHRRRTRHRGLRVPLLFPPHGRMRVHARQASARAAAHLASSSSCRSRCSSAAIVEEAPATLRGAACWASPRSSARGRRVARRALRGLLPPWCSRGGLADNPAATASVPQHSRINFTRTQSSTTRRLQPTPDPKTPPIHPPQIDPEIGPQSIPIGTRLILKNSAPAYTASEVWQYATMRARHVRRRISNRPHCAPCFFECVRTSALISVSGPSGAVEALRWPMHGSTVRPPSWNSDALRRTSVVGKHGPPLLRGGPAWVAQLTCLTEPIPTD